MKLLTTLKKFKRKHTHDAMVLCGSILLLASLVVFATSGVPRAAYAWIIWISPFTYTPVTTGGYTTISWYAPTSDYCRLTGPYTPCISLFPWMPTFKICGYSASGASGSYTVGPITGPTSYHLACKNESGGIGSSEGNGQSSLTVVPTPANTTLSSFTATPTSVVGSGRSTLAWNGTKGTTFSSCQLTGGQWGTAGAWFTALPGSIMTGTIATTTTYAFRCLNTNGVSTPTRTATVTVTPAPDVCSNIPGSQGAAPANGTTSGGVCSCNTGYTLQGASCVAADACSNISGVQATAPTNGVANNNGTCSCNAGYTLQGASCVATPVCSGAHQVGTPPNCTCETGYQMQGGTCVQAQCPGQNEVNWPTCSCATGYSRDTGTNMCIREATLNVTVNGQAATRVRKGTSVSLVWSATGVMAGSCRVTTNTGATLSSTESGSASPAIGNQTTYRLACQNDAGTQVSKEANVTLIPEVIEQ